MFSCFRAIVQSQHSWPKARERVALRARFLNPIHKSQTLDVAFASAAVLQVSNLMKKPFCGLDVSCFHTEV